MADDPWAQFNMDGGPAAPTQPAASPAPAGNYLPAITAPAGVEQYDENGAPLVSFSATDGGRQVPNYGMAGQPGSRGGAAGAAPAQPQSDPWASFKMDDAAHAPEAAAPAAAPAPEAQAAPAPQEAPQTFMQGVGEGTRDVMGGAGQLLNTIQSPLSVPLSALGFKSANYEQLADELADHLGLPKVAHDDHVGSAFRRGAVSGLLTAGVAAPLAAAAPVGSATSAVAGALSSSPLVDAASSGLGQGAAAYTKDAGYSAPVQIGATLLAGAAPSALAGAGSAMRAGANADDLTAVAGRLGVTPTPATVGGGTARFAQKGFSNLPGASAAVAHGSEQEIHGLADAARRAASEIGNVGTRQSAGTTVARGAQAFERASRAAGGALYRERDHLMGGSTAPVSLDNTRGAYADIASQFPSSEALADLRQHPALRRLENALPDASPTDPDAGMLTLHEATDALSHVRGVLRNLSARNQATPAITRRVAAVEQALEDDVTNAARVSDQAAGRAPGAGSAEQAQHDADAYWAARSRALDGALKKPLGSARDAMKVSGEQVYNGLVADMQRKGGNLLRFRQAWTSLPRNARNTFSATMLDDMGRAAAGAQNEAGANWSFNTFLTNYDNLSPGARMIAFGGREQASAIDDIARYAARLRAIGATANHSNTASHGIAATFMAAIGGALFHGDVKTAATIAGTGAAGYPTARLFMSTPSLRMWTRDALRTMGAANARPTQQAAFVPLVRRLTTIAANDPAIAAPVLDLQRHLGAGMAVAAQEPSKGNSR